MVSTEKKPARTDHGTRSSRIVELRSHSPASMDSIGLRSHHCKRRGWHGSVTYITKFFGAWAAGDHCRGGRRSRDWFRVHGWMAVTAEADAQKDGSGAGASGWSSAGLSPQPRERHLLHRNVCRER